MTAVTTIKVFGLKEYDEVTVPVEDLPRLREGFESMVQLAGHSHEPIPTACMHVLRSALLTNNGDTDGYTDAQNRKSIAFTVFIFASHNNDANFDPVRGNFIIVEATFQSFACTVYRADQEAEYRHDLNLAQAHYRNFRGMVEPEGRRARANDGHLGKERSSTVH